MAVKKIKTFGIYRLGPPRHNDFMSMPTRTRVTTVKSTSATEAIKLYIGRLPKGGGWDKKTAIIGKERWRACDLWIRRFTPRGLYKGETHFVAYEVEDDDR